MVSFRTAAERDAEAITRVVNIAFEAERFFIERDRTNPETVRNLIRRGTFLLAENLRELLGCVYYEVRGERGYFGMLSVIPAHQGAGLGHALVNRAENALRDAGCKVCDMKIVNVRTELYKLYRGWGYSETGTARYDDPTPTKIPVHFVLMSKPLA